MNPNNYQRLWRAVIASLAISASLTAMALPDDRQQNYQLQADQQTFDQKHGLVTYTGSARLQQGSLIIKADKIVVHFSKGNTVDRVQATGAPATFEQRPSAEKGVITAQAREIVYHSNSNTIELNTDAQLTQDGAVMKGHSIHYNLTRELVRAEGDKDKRIKMIIPPDMVKQ